MLFKFRFVLRLDHLKFLLMHYVNKVSFKEKDVNSFCYGRGTAKISVLLVVYKHSFEVSRERRLTHPKLTTSNLQKQKQWYLKRRPLMPQLIKFLVVVRDWSNLGGHALEAVYHYLNTKCALKCFANKINSENHLRI